jgi:hypothetical protein
MRQMWEELVTEGHVLAKRYRSGEGLVLVLALLLIVLGFWLVQIAPRLQAGDTGREREAGAQFREREWTRTYKQFAELPAPTFTVADAEKAAPAGELSTVAELTLKSLNTTGALPSELPFAIVSSADFWTKAWAPLDITVVDGADVKLMGAIVDLDPSRYNYVLRRWLGVYRKTPAGWRLRTVVYEPEFVPADFAGLEGYVGDAHPERLSASLKAQR